MFLFKKCRFTNVCGKLDAKYFSGIHAVYFHIKLKVGTYDVIIIHIKESKYFQNTFTIFSLLIGLLKKNSIGGNEIACISGKINGLPLNQKNFFFHNLINNENIVKVF